MSLVINLVKEKFTNFMDFVEGSDIHEKARNVFLESKEYNAQTFMAYIAAVIYPFWRDGKCAEKIDELILEYTGGEVNTMAAACTDADARDKFMRYINFFCEVIHEDVQATIKQASQKAKKKT